MNDDQLPLDQTQPTSKIHTWIIILLVWTAVFSLISVGLLVTKPSSSSLSQSDITSACQNGTINAITTNLTRIADACVTGQEGKKDTTPIVAMVKSDGIYPSFSYPVGWHIVGTPMETNGYAIKMRDEPLLECDGCDGINIPIRIYILDKVKMLAGKTPEDYVKAQYADATFYSNAKITSASVAGGTLFTVTVDVKDMISTPTIDELFFFGPTKIAEVSHQIESDPAKIAGWEIVKNSIDWSTVK